MKRKEAWLIASTLWDARSQTSPGLKDANARVRTLNDLTGRQQMLVREEAELIRMLNDGCHPDARTSPRTELQARFDAHDEEVERALADSPSSDR